MFINLTPHNICVLKQNGETQTIPPSGTVCRCSATTKLIDVIDDIEIIETTYGELEGLPEPQPGVIYITSTPAAIKARQQGRIDVLSPDTGSTAIRNEHGHIVAVRRLQRP